MEEDKQKLLQQKYMELQMNHQQIKQVQQQMQALEQQVEEINSVRENLKELKDVKEGSEILVSLSSGIFAKAVIKDTKNLTVNVGGGTAVERSIPEVITTLRVQAEELEKIQAKMAEQFELMASQAQVVEKELNEIAIKAKE